MFGGIFSILFTVHRRHNMHSYSFTSVCDFFFKYVSMYNKKQKYEHIFVSRKCANTSKILIIMLAYYRTTCAEWKYNAIASG